MTSAEYGVDVLDESYVRHGERHVLMRIYVPRGRGPFPTLLSVHGGWNSGGDRYTKVGLDRAMAARGNLVMVAGFRMPPLAQYPASIADVHLAARWARVNAARFRGRADRLGGLGTSSGAHMLLLNTLLLRDPRYSALPLEPPSRPPPRPLLDYLAMGWPIIEPLDRYRWARCNRLDKIVRSHERYWGDEAAMADGSPQRILDRHGQDPGPLPDLLAVQGADDEKIPPGATERFTESWAAAGGKAELHMYAGMQHGFIYRDIGHPNSVAAIDLMAGFVARQSAPECSSAAG